MAKGRGLIGILITLGFTLIFASCDSKVYYDQSRTVDEHGWLPSDTVSFDVQIDDTTRMYNCLIEVRNSVSYPYSNTFLFIGTTFPDGSVAHDTLECPLADAEGRWLGKHTGRYVDTRFRLRRGTFRFPMTGNYHFAITNGMRDSAISGLHDIGLRLEYVKTK
ncbi:MAG: gliding motility lipoprotein GldH [Bacteroidales bacterium]|nr:gliding motility lipoprotein GldH [Bacteroidales bacterium]